MKHCRKVKGEQVITLQMVQQLKPKPKILMLYKDNYFIVTLKLNFCEKQRLFIDEEGKFQSVTGTDKDFAECETPTKSSNQLAFHLSVYTKYLRSVE